MPSSDLPPPTVPVPEGWRVASDELTTPFDVRVVSVRAHTVVLADDALRERVEERVQADADSGADATWRFFFASRLRLDPASPPSRAVTRIVANRANTGFADALRERGFDAVRAADSRRWSVREETADLTRYEARVTVGDVSVDVEAYFTVWSDGSDFLAAGGAYPRAVASGPDAVAACFEPERFREELFEMVRATR